MRPAIAVGVNAPSIDGGSAAPGMDEAKEGARTLAKVLHASISRSHQLHRKRTD
jgi:hypothetical protein